MTHCHDNIRRLKLLLLNYLELIGMLQDLLRNVPVPVNFLTALLCDIIPHVIYSILECGLVAATIGAPDKGGGCTA